MNFKKSLIGATVASILALSACGKSNTDVSMDTHEFDKNAQAVLHVAQTISSLPALNGHVSKNDLDTMNSVVGNMSSSIASVDKSTNGKVDINTSRGAASAFEQGSDTLFKIATPLLQKYAPQYVKDVALARTLAPVLSGLVEAFGANDPHTKQIKEEQAKSLRAEIYKDLPEK